MFGQNPSGSATMLKQKPDLFFSRSQKMQCIFNCQKGWGFIHTGEWLLHMVGAGLTLFGKSTFL